MSGKRGAFCGSAFYPHQVAAFPSTVGLIKVVGRELVASSVVGKVEREGSKLVKVSRLASLKRQSTWKRSSLLLPRSEGWVHHGFNASGGGERPAAASLGIDGGGSGRAYATTSFFLKLVDVGLGFFCIIVSL